MSDKKQLQDQINWDELHQKIQHLESFFLSAIEMRQNGMVEQAEKTFLAILKEEPRLAEPHLELAHIYLNAVKLEEAKTHIDEAINNLESGGQWLDMPENELLSMAYAIKGEIFRAYADQDDVIFGNVTLWKDLTQEAKKAFQKAAELDPQKQDQYVQTWGFEPHWMNNLEKEVNEVLSKSPESEHQPADQSHHTDPDQS